MVDLDGPGSGLHPGFVVLDEPLQQNQDTKHRQLFVDYLVNQGTKQPPYQVIIFTYLFDAEIARLRASGVTLQTPETSERQHFLELVTSPNPATNGGESQTSPQ